jgi:sucrose phosphorylase
MKHTKHLTKWLKNLPETSQETTFFNFLSSHDGVGLRPIEGIIDDEEKSQMIDILLKRGAKINYRSLSNGSKTPYEVCITYTDALSDPEETDQIRAQKLIGAHRILLSLQGLPAIYYHTLLGSRNDEIGYEVSKINRRINREKLDYSQLSSEIDQQHHLRNLVFYKMKEMILYRRNEPLFHPQVQQSILDVSQQVLAIVRTDGKGEILTLVNVTDQHVSISLQGKYQDVTSNHLYKELITLKPYDSGWFKKL